MKNMNLEWNDNLDIMLERERLKMKMNNDLNITKNSLKYSKIAQLHNTEMQYSSVKRTSAQIQIKVQVLRQEFAKVII